MSQKSFTSWWINIGTFFVGMIFAFFMSYQLYFSQTASVGDAVISSWNTIWWESDILVYHDEHTISLQSNKVFEMSDDRSMRIEFFVWDDSIMNHDMISSPYPYTIAVWSWTVVILLSLSDLDYQSEIVNISLPSSKIIINTIEFFDDMSIEILSFSILSAWGTNHISL